MTWSIKKRSEKRGLPPGTPVYVGEEREGAARVTLIDYNARRFLEAEVHAAEECIPYKDRPSVTWVNVDGVHDVQTVAAVAECFGLHPLTVEDITNVHQRPKLDDYGDYVYIVARSLSYEEDKLELATDQNSIIVGKNFVLTFQERPGDEFGMVRDRLRAGDARLRRGGADFLAYSLLDAVVDNYFAILEKVGERIEFLEDELVGRPTREMLEVIHDLKRVLVYLRKAVWPLREVLATLERRATPIFKPDTTTYLRDVYDHVIQIIDTIETYRDMMSGILDIYLSSVSNRLNEVMKVLTIIATIFIPLTFIAGIYGMNFHYMPELEWRWGYPAVWAVMAGIGVVMLIIFRRRRWL